MKSHTPLVLLIPLLLGTGPALAIEIGGDATRGEARSQVCAACHGADGNSTNPQYPKIADLGASYLYKQLKDYKEGRRQNAVMSGIVATLSDQDMRDLAAYFAAQMRTSGTTDEAQPRLGQRLFQDGNGATGVPACASCHAPDGAGNPATKFPALAGQHPEYLADQLHGFRKGERANDAGKMMRNIAPKLSDAEIRAVSEYIHGLQAEPGQQRESL